MNTGIGFKYLALISCNEPFSEMDRNVAVGKPAIGCVETWGEVVRGLDRKPTDQSKNG